MGNYFQRTIGLEITHVCVRARACVWEL